MRKRHLVLPAVLALLGVTSGCTQHLVVGVAPTTSKLTGPQPGMVTVRSAGGVAYSIDSTEVSQAAYALFLQAHPQPDPTSATCGWKTTHVPGSEPSDANQLEGDPTECHPGSSYYDPIAHGGDPVVCVDWCDAAAYCAWAGKRLCGRVGGGPSAENAFADAATDQWFGACSNGGSTAFPYGAAYVPGACADGAAVAPVGTMAACHGTTSPFDGIFDLSGNVYEWEDACAAWPGSTAGGVPSDRCLIRGGTFGDGSAQDLSCGGSNVGDPRNMARPRTGIRCCVD